MDIFAKILTGLVIRVAERSIVVVSPAVLRMSTHLVSTLIRLTDRG